MQCHAMGANAVAECIYLKELNMEYEFDRFAAEEQLLRPNVVAQLNEEERNEIYIGI